MIQYLGNMPDEMIDDRVWPFLDLESMGYSVESNPRSGFFDDGPDLADFFAGPHRCTELFVFCQNNRFVDFLGMTNHHVWSLVRNCRLHILDRCGRPASALQILVRQRL